MKRALKGNLFFIIFILATSIYFSTGIHEFGHVAAEFYYGCKIPVAYVGFPIPIGFTHCELPEDGVFEDSLSQSALNNLTIWGPLFVSIIGIILLFLYKIKLERSNYKLAVIFYFFTFGCLSNGFLQSISSSDLNYLIKHGFNPFYSYILAAILGLLIIYQLFLFKNLLKIVNPNIDKREIRRFSIIWTSIVALYFSIYLFIIPLVF